MMDEIKGLFSREKAPQEPVDEERPVKFVQDGFNSWRVVWAD